MEFRTPLLDCFKRGEVPRDVRILAAKGAFAPRAQEQLALLVMLAKDGDQEIAGVAARTIDGLPPEPLARFIARTDTPDEIRTFFVKRGVTPGKPATDDEPLVTAESGDDDPESAVIQSAAKEADEKKAVADLRAKGMQVVENVDKSKFQAVLGPTFAEFGKKFGQENIDRIRNYK